MLIVVAGREKPVAHHESLAETGEFPESSANFRFTGSRSMP
jgi:hypothetical protein